MFWWEVWTWPVFFMKLVSAHLWELGRRHLETVHPRSCRIFHDGRLTPNCKTVQKADRREDSSSRSIVLNLATSLSAGGGAVQLP